TGLAGEAYLIKELPCLEPPETGLERLFLPRPRQGLQEAERHVAPDHRRRLEQLPVSGWQAVDPHGEQGLDGHGHLDRLHGPALVGLSGGPAPGVRPRGPPPRRRSRPGPAPFPRRRARCPPSGRSRSVRAGADWRRCPGAAATAPPCPPA